MPLHMQVDGPMGVCIDFMYRLESMVKKLQFLL